MFLSQMVDGPKISWEILTFFFSIVWSIVLDISMRLRRGRFRWSYYAELIDVKNLDMLGKCSVESSLKNEPWVLQWDL